MKQIFYWMIGGVLLTTAAFFVPEQSGSMWPSVISASTVATGYLGIFLAVWLRKLSSSRKKTVIAVVCTTLIVFSGATAIISYEGSMRQQDTLVEIRETIERGISYNHIQKPLMDTFSTYHNTGSNNMGQLFVSRYDSIITDDQAFQYEKRDEDEQTLFLHVAKTTADSVVLVGESTILNGRQSDFNNYSGSEGRYQVKGILTSKGIDYERQN